VDHAELAAVELLAGATRWRSDRDVPVPLNERAEHEAMLARIRARLPAAAFDTVWARGWATSLASTAEVALRLPIPRLP
jgi:hypothetical protein